MHALDRNLYHLFPLGFCGAKAYARDEESTQHTLRKINEIVPYLKELGINTLLLGPVNESVSHGYDTTDYFQIDHRLGDRDDLKELVEVCHENGIEVILDCVFNHVGREHEAFLDLKNNREGSRYKDWFMDVNFGWNNSFNDGFSYANWAGHDELVKLNLYNPEVKDYLKNVLADWIDTYDIDGVRMDAANVMNREFLAELADFARSKKEGFFFIGEIVGGDYSELVRNGHLDTITNYECYKGLYSSLNSKNYFEIAHSIRRLFDQGHGLLGDIPSYNFADNHDVERVATTIRDKRLLNNLYILLYTMPGFPTIYYGSEQAMEGRKEYGSDAALRPPLEKMSLDTDNDLFKLIKKLGEIRDNLDTLRSGTYQELFIQPEQYGFRRLGEKPVTVLLNMNEEEATVNCDLHGDFHDYLNEEDLNCDGSVMIPPFSGRILVEN